ncbi:RNA dependent RNA polymerase [Rosellinia necatrix quadrivirus 1]|uniref:RNA-directed RNA polymerase n=1 Tax=Rosellinia necatrix quadrivirus 1 TaxID=1000373 RepID=H1ACC7_RNQV1|nr:RNA dependent RNA polymerase [Rosellinia necatrix quadrivirus 1]BAL46425.1 RNA dependent RNA polymerase [Rosellinia necatrix quadrivirus 1]
MDSTDNIEHDTYREDIRYERSRMGYRAKARTLITNGKEYRLRQSAWRMLSKQGTRDLLLQGRKCADELGTGDGHIYSQVSQEMATMLREIGYSGGRADVPITVYRPRERSAARVETKAVLEAVLDYVQRADSQKVELDVAAMSEHELCSQISYLRPSTVVGLGMTWAPTRTEGHWMEDALINACTEAFKEAENVVSDDLVQANLIVEALLTKMIRSNIVFDADYGKDARRVEPHERSSGLDLTAAAKLCQGNTVVQELFRFCEQIYYDAFDKWLAGSKTARGRALRQANPILVDRSVSDTSCNDWLLARMEDVWFDWNVTGWISAAMIAIYINSDPTTRQLSGHEQRLVAKSFYKGSTWRKLVDISATMDATPDRESGEVTAAALRMVRLRAPLNAITALCDDLEYAYRSGTVLEDHERALLAAKFGKITAAELYYEAPAELKSSTDSIKQPPYVRIIEEDGEYTYQECALADANAVLLGWEHTADKPASKTTAVLTGEEYAVFSFSDQSLRASYIRYDTCENKLHNVVAAHAGGSLYRENSFGCSAPIVEFLDQFGQQYEALMTPAERVNLLMALSTPTITQQHHQHLSLTNVLNSIGAWDCVLDHVLAWPDINYTMFTTVALALSGLPAQARYLMNTWRGWSCESAQAYHKVAKNFSTTCKSLDNKVTLLGEPLDLAVFFEWETVLNRGFGKMSWSDEIRDRRDLTQNVDLGVPEAEQHIRDIMLEIKSKMKKRGGKLLLNRTWEQFYSARSRETPAGSASSLDPYILECKQKVKDATKADITKTQVLSFMADGYTIDQLLSKKPQVLATVSIKYEWGKMRALFAAVVEHYLLAAFAFTGVEDFMPNDCPVGKGADASAVCSKVMAMAKSSVYVCVDAANFNILHTFALMSAVIRIYGEVFHDWLSPEQQETVRWLMEAELDQRVVLNKSQLDAELYEEGMRDGWITQHGDKLIVQVLGGLFSGHRLTMFINTVLNRVYYRVAAARAHTEPDALHSGDDVFACYQSIGEALRVKAGFKSFGYTLQLTKCFLLGVAEFLRISHKNNNTSQYYARSCATSVHGRIETGEANDMQALATANITRACEAMLRYGERRVFMQVVAMQNAGVCARWSVPTYVYAAYIITPTLLGGMRCGHSEESLLSNFAIERIANVNSPAVAFFQQTPGVKQAARDIVQALGLTEHYNRAGRAIAAGIATRSVLSAFSMSLRWMGDQVHVAMKRWAGKYAHIRQSRDYILSKSVGLFNLLWEEGHFGEQFDRVTQVHSSWLGKILEVALMPAQVIKNGLADTLMDKVGMLSEVRRIQAGMREW